MSILNKNLIYNLIILSFGLFIFILSLIGNSVSVSSLGPSFMPKIVSFSLVLLSMVNIVVDVRIDKKNKTKEDKRDVNVVNVLLTFTSLGLYVFLFDYLGFILSTFIYVFFQLILLSEENKNSWVLMLMISIFSSVFIYLFFIYGFNVIMPKGIFY